MKKIILILVVVILAGGAGYYKFYKGNLMNKDNANAGETNAPKINLPKLDENLKDLKVTTLKEGTGRAIEKGMVAYVIYAGFLPDGTVFDSNAQTGQPIGFPIGEGAVIKGWDQGLLGVKEGSEVILDIPADLAYGAEGVKDRIPANSPLRFDVFVVKVLTKEELKKLQEQAQAQAKTAKPEITTEEGAKDSGQ